MNALASISSIAGREIEQSIAIVALIIVPCGIYLASGLSFLSPTRRRLIVFVLPGLLFLLCGLIFGSIVHRVLVHGRVFPSLGDILVSYLVLAVGFGMAVRSFRLLALPNRINGSVFTFLYGTVILLEGVTRFARWPLTIFGGWDVEWTPVWIVMGAFWACWAIVIWPVNRHLAKLHDIRRRGCPECGYDLRGSAGRDRCPECGCAIPSGARTGTGESDLHLAAIASIVVAVTLALVLCPWAVVVYWRMLDEVLGFSSSLLWKAVFCVGVGIALELGIAYVCVRLWDRRQFTALVSLVMVIAFLAAACVPVYQIVTNHEKVVLFFR